MYAETNTKNNQELYNQFMSEARLIEYQHAPVVIVEMMTRGGIKYARLTVPDAGILFDRAVAIPLEAPEPVSLANRSSTVVSHKFKNQINCVECGQRLTLGNLGFPLTPNEWKADLGQRMGVCKNCMHESRSTRCSHIGCLAGRNIDDPDQLHHWCNHHALQHGFHKCCLTGDLVHESQSVRFGTFYVKTSMAAKVAFKCEDCGRPMLNDETKYHYMEHNFCSQECAFAKDFYICGRCGTLHPKSNLREDEDSGRGLCPHCWEYVYHQIRAREPRKDYDESTRGVKPTFGFEIELYRWPSESHREWLPRTWGIHEDTTTGSGYEVLTPVVHLDQFESHIKCVMDYLIENSQVTRKEGTHMHVGNFVNHDHAFRFWQLAVESERLWAKWFISESRRINQYCKDTNEEYVTIKSTDFTTSSRYVKTNAQSYAEHGTVEIRAHQGTLDFRKMQMWARLFSQLWYHARDHKPMPRTNNMLNFFTDVAMPNDIAEYWKGRAADLREEVTPLEQMTAKDFFRPTVYIYGENLRKTMCTDSTWQQIYSIGMTEFRNLPTDDRALWNMLFEAMTCDEENTTFSTTSYMSLNPEPGETPANLETNIVTL